VQLVGVQYHQLSGQRVSGAASIVEALHAIERNGKGVGVMAVRRKGRARKTGFDAFELAGRTNDPVFTLRCQSSSLH
jgi:hypothetical protein